MNYKCAAVILLALAPAAGAVDQYSTTLTAFQLRSGILYADDFNDGTLDVGKWVEMQHREIFPAEENGYLVVQGTPTENAKGWWHAGAMTTRSVTTGLPDAVMAVKYVVPDWDYPCTLDWEEFPIYEAHLCNDSPDRNHSIQISRMCPHSGATEALFGGLNSDQLPKEQINNTGVEMFVSYNDGLAQGFILDKDRNVHPATEATRLPIEDHKRVELKSVLAHPGVEVNLKVDWAVLYNHPSDAPARFRIAEFAATEVIVKLGGWRRSAPVVDGFATVYLPDKILYPSAARVTVINGETTIAETVIPRDSDLGGLYPGDTWLLLDRAISGC